MKNIIKLLALPVVVLFALTGCVKDKDYENGKYGIEITERPAVSFPQFSSAPLSASLNSSTTAQTFSTALVVEANGPATSDISVTIATDTVGFAAAGLTVFPASAYSVSTAQVIPSGSKLASVVVTFPNTSTLNPSLKYGIAMTITSVSSGYQIATNMKRVIFGFSIKNAYDGIYNVVSGSVQRYAGPGATNPEAAGGLNGSLAGNPDVTLITTGPNSVGIPIPGNPNPGTLYWANGSNSQVAGIDNVRITVDASNQVSMSSLLNTTLANWETKENRYDPATKTFYLNFRWNPTANRREYSVILKYSKAR